MSQRFVRCPHCALPHAASDEVCPLTGKAIELRKASLHPSGPPAGASPSRPPSQPSLEPPRASSRPPEPRASLAPTPAAASSPPSGPPANVVDRRRLVGTVVGGQYLVRSIIGQGGMATVYEAEHLTLGRTVALKVLPLERVASLEARRRFVQEARAAASIAHPNICQVYDFGTLADHTLYFAMERLSGEALSERIARSGGLVLLELIDIVLQALAGLGAAHRKGIVHRDIKPENVFLVLNDERSIVKLVDFGLAKLNEGPGEDTVTQLTRTGIVMGTPFYMSPEQVIGDRVFDARVDVWSTGVVMYEAATGKLPFKGQNWAETVNLICREPHRPMHELRPNVPPALERVVARALAKERDARYPSAADLAADLVRIRPLVKAERRE